MAVRSRNAQQELARNETRHWRGLAQRSGAEGTWAAMQALVARVEPAITAVQARLPPGFPERTAETIFAGLRQQLWAWELGLRAPA